MEVVVGAAAAVVGVEAVVEMVVVDVVFAALLHTVASLERRRQNYFETVCDEVKVDVEISCPVCFCLKKGKKRKRRNGNVFDEEALVGEVLPPGDWLRALPTW